MNPTTVEVVPVRFADDITDCVTGIATATIIIVPKITTRTLPPICPRFPNILIKSPYKFIVLYIGVFIFFGKVLYT